MSYITSWSHRSDGRRRAAWRNFIKHSSLCYCSYYDWDAESSVACSQYYSVGVCGVVGRNKTQEEEESPCGPPWWCVCVCDLQVYLRRHFNSVWWGVKVLALVSSPSSWSLTSSSSFSSSSSSSSLHPSLSQSPSQLQYPLCRLLLPLLEDCWNNISELCVRQEASHAG